MTGQLQWVACRSKFNISGSLRTKLELCHLLFAQLLQLPTRASDVSFDVSDCTVTPLKHRRRLNKVFPFAPKRLLNLWPHHCTIYIYIILCQFVLFHGAPLWGLLLRGDEKSSATTSALQDGRLLQLEQRWENHMQACPATRHRFHTFMLFLVYSSSDASE